MSLRIESDGTAVGTKVIEDETGVELQNQITSLTWELDIKTGVARVQLGFVAAVLDVVAPDESLRPLLGMLNGAPIYEYSWEVWCNPAFASTYQYRPTEEEIAKVILETRSLLRI